MSESVNIGRTIARERRRAGATQEALAAHLGVSKAAVRVLALFPINFANFSVLYTALESYPLGPAVLDLVGMVLLVYAALALVSAPVAAISFRRHQVA